MTPQSGAPRTEASGNRSQTRAPSASTAYYRRRDARSLVPPTRTCSYFVTESYLESTHSTRRRGVILGPPHRVAPPDTRSLAIDADGVIYANVHVGGVVRTADVDGAWEPTIDVDADVHEIVFDASSGSLFAASAIGLASSDDGGGTWSFYTEGLHGIYQRAVAVAGEAILVTASTGPRSDRAAIFSKPVRKAEPFTKCENGLPKWFPSNINTFCLSAASDAAAFGTSEGEVYLSIDQGVSWNRIVESLPAVQAILVI